MQEAAMSAASTMRERPLVLVLVDLARFTQAVAGRSLQELTALVDAFYRHAGTVIPRHGGRVVKFIGDGCFAVFEVDDALAALDAVEELRGRVNEMQLDLGANVHMSTVAEAELGLDGAYDVLGMGVVHTFRMGGGPGTRISERVYRKLPADRRSEWRKHQPPATYELER
jgi:class 3 adenylate cyclase